MTKYKVEEGKLVRVGEAVDMSKYPEYVKIPSSIFIKLLTTKWMWRYENKKYSLTVLPDKAYKLIDVYGGNYVIIDEFGNRLNGHGVNSDRFVPAKKGEDKASSFFY